jgi:GTP-binding protein
MFLDYAVIYVASGAGGAGKVSFRRAKFQPKGGPDGGNGGRGGDVILRGNPHKNTLLDFRYKQHFRADNGQPGEGSNWTGKSAAPLVIEVPCGTVVYDADTEGILADITEPFQQVVIAKGGRGGLGNSEFATSTNQAPRHAQPGEPSVELKLRLELKLIADVGLVGFPNAGKSTLISVISAAKPKIADYPFTTLVPNLGIVSVQDGERYEGKTFCVADIPGLIEGAHEGKGLGMQFLRHVERNRVLLFLLDSTAEMPPQDQYKTLRKELKLYNPDLDHKPRIICLTKMDAHDESTKATFAKMKFRDPKTPVYTISAVSGEGIDNLKRAMWQLLQRNDEPIAIMPSITSRPQ